MWPDTKWIGGPIILVGVLALVFDVRLERGHLEVGTPQSLGRRLLAMAPQLLMVISVIGFAVGLVWYLRSAPSPQTVASASSPPQNTADYPILSPPQERLLGLIADYQRQFAATKLIIARKDGTLHFDNEPTKGKGINLILDLYGLDDPVSQAKFERLVESIPPEYLRLLPEIRWGSPFVVSVADAGLLYLRSHVPSKPATAEISPPSSAPARSSDGGNTPEYHRRALLLGKLSQEYILSHDGISPALAAGTEPVPADWMNQRLEQMGEAWRVRLKGIGYEMFPLSTPLIASPKMSG